MQSPYSALLPLKPENHLSKDFFPVPRFSCCKQCKAISLKCLCVLCFACNSRPLRNIYSIQVAHHDHCQNNANGFLSPVPAMQEVYKKDHTLRHNREDKEHRD